MMMAGTVEHCSGLASLGCPPGTVPRCRAWIGGRGGRLGPYGHDAMPLVGIGATWIERGERGACPAVHWLLAGQGSTDQTRKC